MANYVYNYLFCDKEAKDRITSLDIVQINRLNGCYDKVVIPIKDDKYLVIFDTRGMDYRTEFIIEFIQEFNNTRWYCIEENEVEQGFYFWNGFEVEFRSRELIQSLGGKEIIIKFSDNNFRPLRKIFISDERIVFDNIIKNEVRNYFFSSEQQTRIENHIGTILCEESDVLAIPIKNGIACELSIHWENKEFFIESFDENDKWNINVKESESFFDKTLSFLNSILIDEGIEEVISFELQDKYLNDNQDEKNDLKKIRTISIIKRIKIELETEVRGKISAVEIWVFSGNIYYYKKNNVYLIDYLLGDKHEYNNNLKSDYSVKEFYDQLDKINILQWKKQYGPDINIMDGYEWRLEYETYNNKTIFLQGFNVYPKGWNDFIGVICSVVGDFGFPE